MNLPTFDCNPVYTVSIDLTCEQITQIILDALKEKVPHQGDAIVHYTITPRYYRNDVRIGDELTGAKITFQTDNLESLR